MYGLRWLLKLLQWDAVVAQQWKETVNSHLSVSYCCGVCTAAWRTEMENWGGCGGVMLIEKLHPPKKPGEKTELEELNSCMFALCVPFQYCPAKCFRTRCSSWGEGERRPFPFFHLALSTQRVKLGHSFSRRCCPLWGVAPTGGHAEES